MIDVHPTAYIDPRANVEDGAYVGAGTKIWAWTHVRKGAKIGEYCNVGEHVYIDTGAIIGDNCKIQNSTNIYNGVVIGDGVFIGQGVNFTNDRYPRAVNSDGELCGAKDWTLEHTYVKDRVSIGAGAIIVCGVTIGEESTIGAGAVVTKDVPPMTMVVGVPAKPIIYKNTDSNMDAHIETDIHEW